MKILRPIVIAALLTGLCSVTNAVKKSADEQAADAACVKAAETAGCGSKEIGTGLLKCLHAYKKAHKDSTYADECKAAVKKMRQNRKNGK